MNNSTIITTEMLYLFNDVMSSRRLPATIFTWIILIIGVLGNITVMAAYGRLMHKKNRPAGGRYLIQVLAIADLTACVFGGSFFLYFDYHRVTFRNTYLCKFAMFSSFTTNIISILCLLVISVHRYLKICNPHGRQMTVFWRRIAISGVVILSIMVSSPYFHFAQVVEKRIKPVVLSKVLSLNDISFAASEITAHTCWAGYPRNVAWKTFYNLLFVIQLGNVIIMVILYVLIGRVLSKKNKQTRGSPIAKQEGPDIGKSQIQSATSGCSTIDSTYQASTSQCNTTDIVKNLDDKNEGWIQQHHCTRQKTTWSSAKSRFTRMFMVIVIVYAVTNFPTFIFIYMIVESETFDKYFIFRAPYPIFNLILSLTRVHLINNAINPFIYGYFDIEFRRSIKKIFIDSCLHPRKRISKIKKRSQSMARNENALSKTEF